MSMPRTTRLLVGLLSAALLGLVPVGLASPAQAGTTETQITAKISRPTAVFRQSFTISGDTDCAGVPADGDIELLRRKAGSERWVSLGVSPASDFHFKLLAIQNADYVLDYPGSASCSATWSGGSQKVYRKMNDWNPRGTLIIKGKVQPAWKRKPVIVQVKKAGRWVKYAKVITNRKSQWSKKLYARRGTRTKFRAFVKGTTAFQKTYTGLWVTTVQYYREVPRVSAR